LHGLARRPELKIEAVGAFREAIGSLDFMWVAASAGWLAGLAGGIAIAIQRRALTRLRTEIRAGWQDAFVTYQRAHYLPFAETLRVAYQRFIDGRPGVPLTWEQATHQARWPRDTPLPPGTPLRDWRSRCGAALGRDDEFLLRFCEAIYPPAEPSNLQSHRARSIMTPEEFDVFHRARVGVADYFHQCGSRRARSAKFARFLEREVRVNHYYRIKIVAYLEIALSRARADFPEADREHEGLFRLGGTWRVDDGQASEGDETDPLHTTTLERLASRRRSKTVKSATESAHERRGSASPRTTAWKCSIMPR